MTAHLANDFHTRHSDGDAILRYTLLYHFMLHIQLVITGYIHGIQVNLHDVIMSNLVQQ